MWFLLFIDCVTIIKVEFNCSGFTCDESIEIEISGLTRERKNERMDGWMDKWVFNFELCHRHIVYIYSTRAFNRWAPATRDEQWKTFIKIITKLQSNFVTLLPNIASVDRWWLILIYNGVYLTRTIILSKNNIHSDHQSYTHVIPYCFIRLSIRALQQWLAILSQNICCYHFEQNEQRWKPQNKIEKKTTTSR